jgi:hypothetical protein
MKSLQLLWIASMCLATTYLCGQGQFTIKYSHDTIVQDEVLKVEFIAINVEGRFIPPDFTGFTVASGPMVSTQFSSINGKVEQRASYTYMLIPVDIGAYEIGPATIQGETTQLNTPATPIVVLERNTSYTRSKSATRSSQSSTPVKKRVLRKI